MIKVKQFDNLGKELEALSLNEEIFGAKVNENFIHQAVVTQLANARMSNSHSKTRAEVSGSGKKPWRQKGTGRARSGSVRNPVWVGGGITFGPTNLRNYSKKFPKRMKRQALFQALSSKVSDKQFIVVEKIDFKEAKTKLAIKFLESLPELNGKMLVAIAKPDSKVELAFKNIPYVKTILARNLNIIDILKFDWLIISVDGLKELENVFLKSATDKIQEVVKKVKKTTVKKETKVESETK